MHHNVIEIQAQIREPQVEVSHLQPRASRFPDAVFNFSENAPAKTFIVVEQQHERDYRAQQQHYDCRQAAKNDFFPLLHLFTISKAHHFRMPVPASQRTAMS